VANRGEIAVRIIRTLKAEGLRALAIFSDADAGALHVRLADAAIHIGGVPAGEAYLDIGRILDAAARLGAEAVHPGYGFLSENPDFRSACDQAGLVFIGPSASSMALMGDKHRARAFAASQDVPCIPGFDQAGASDADLVQAAQSLGTPLMIKAAAGGGGKGIRQVDHPKELAAAITSARSEALRTFGNDALFLEKAIDHARHIEVQILADQHGNVRSLGDRECSIQRRHQKILEEAPAPCLSDECRQQLHAAAVRLATACQYENAGTVEFLLDSDGQFYFLEMNTRLQVEHAVTEQVFEVDLVALQCQIAAGEPIPPGLPASPQGHAIEVRLCAEDPRQDCLPQTGILLDWHPASTGRIDHGLQAGDRIGTHYDALLARLIAQGDTRTQALNRLVRMLEDTRLPGITSNKSLLLLLLAQPDVRQAKVYTSWLDERLSGWRDDLVPCDLPALAALVDMARFNPGRQIPGWSNTHQPVWRRRLRIDHTDYCLVIRSAPGGCTIEAGAEQWQAQWLSTAPQRLQVRLNHRLYNIHWYQAGESLWLDAGEGAVCFRPTPLSSSARPETPGQVYAPMDARVIRVLVRPGQHIEADTPLVVLEAMKMEQTLTSTVPGRIGPLSIQPGTQVSRGQPLIQILDHADEVNHG
jgi:geranyl-CoA carboxylase alpha subunit